MTCEVIDLPRGFGSSCRYRRASPCLPRLTMEVPMPAFFPTVFVSRVLLLDAVTCAAMGALLTGLSSTLAPVLGLPMALLLWAGILLFPSAGLMVIAASLKPFRSLLCWLVVAGNVLWVVASIAVLTELEPTPLGLAFVLVQAAAVAILAMFEWRGIRQASVGVLARA
jgi:hypothetical protein